MVNFRYVMMLVLLAGIAGTSNGQDKYWYKSFSGTIDKYPVTLHIHKEDHSISGYYYYNKTQRPLSITGDDTAIAGKIRLQSWGPDSESDNELFTLSLEGDSLTGEWKKNATSANPGLPVKTRINTSLSPAFDLVYTSGSVKLRPKMADSPSANYEASAVWPKGNSPAAAALKKLISESFGLKGTQADLGPLLLADKKSFFAGYLEDNKNVPDSELVNYTSGYSQDVISRVGVVFHSPTILSLSHMSYAFTGGAHGNYGTAHICINPATGKTYTLSMVLSASGKKQLNGLLEKNFRKERNLSATAPLTEAGLFENKITATDNFYLTGTGITFNYTPYEIGPYAMGEVEVFIPYSDFGTGGLNPSFKK